MGFWENRENDKKFEAARTMAIHGKQATDKKIWGDGIDKMIDSARTDDQIQIVLAHSKACDKHNYAKVLAKQFEINSPTAKKEEKKPEEKKPEPAK